MFAFLSRRPSPRLQERLEEVEGAQKVLELQMEELKHLYRKLIGRMKWDTKVDGPDDHPETGPQAVTGASGTSGRRLLTPRQQQLQQEILKRRAGG